MSLSKDNIIKLEKIANALDKSGQEDKMVIADNIDGLLKAQAALKKISIEILHPKLLSWLSQNFPRALQNVNDAKNALKNLVGLGSGGIEGVAIQDINNLRGELQKVISGSGDPVGVHEIR